MVAIQNFLSSIGDAIVFAFHFLISMFKDFFEILEWLYKLPESIYNLFSWLPPDLLRLLLVLVTFIVIYKILGREG